MLKNESILVLTTRKRAWWLSMQEIIPAIERVWTGIGQSGREDVQMLCVPLEPEIEQRLQISASQLKRIVITSMAPEAVRVALLLRVQMKVAAPMIIYISGDPIEGFYTWGPIANFLTKRDILVVSCEAEATAVRRYFPNAEISIIPFPLMDQFKLANGSQYSKGDTVRLAYVGRVSEQKNLHTLLFSLWLMRTYFDYVPRIKLDVYGGQDNHGSPNMGLAFPDYDAYLQRLTGSLNLEEMVTWHGFKPREWLFDNVHLSPHILVSPTLHSDENFGSSVLASLANGHQVVTTAWGGHFGFQEWFPQQLMLVPVHRSTMGPVVHPILLANTILQSIGEMPRAVVKEAILDRARTEFSERTAIARALELLSRPDGDPVPLEKSPIQQYIEEKRTLSGGIRQIYSSYEDPVAQIFFEAYGMKEPLIFDERSSYILPPWAEYNGHSLRIVDPHRGNQFYRLDTGTSKQLDIIMCPSRETCCLPEDLVKSLVAQGYAFALPPPDAPRGPGVLHRPV